MSEDRWIVIPKWDEFQHRDMARSSVPPWIKTYTKLMGDDDFLSLSFHLRGVLVSLWLEYATARRQLRDSTVALTRRLGQRVTTRDLETLNHAGFITFSASRPASSFASEPASLEVEVEKKDLKAFRARAKPPDPVELVCPECGYTDTRQHEMTKHLRVVHWIEPPPDPVAVNGNLAHPDYDPDEPGPE